MAIICQFLVVDINIILLFTIVNLPFLILSYLPFQKKKEKKETLETWHNWLLSN